MAMALVPVFNADRIVASLDGNLLAMRVAPLALAVPRAPSADDFWGNLSTQRAPLLALDLSGLPALPSERIPLQLYLLCISQFQKGDFHKLSSLLDRLAQVRPAWANGLRVLALHVQGRDSEALAEVVRGGGAEVLSVIEHSRAVDHTQAGRVEKAIESCRVAIALTSEPYPIVWRLAHLLYRSRRFDEALVEFQRAIELDPSEPTAYIRVADIYQLQGQYELARAYLDRLSALSPSCRELAYTWIGIGESQQRHDEEALYWYRRALEVNPSSAEALGQTGLLHVKRKQFQEGILYLEQATKLLPQASYWWKQLLEAQYGARDCENARETVRRAQQALGSSLEISDEVTSWLAACSG